MKNNIFRKNRLFLSALLTFMAFLFVQNVAAQNDSYVIIINAKNTATESNANKRYLRNIFMLNKSSWPEGTRARPVLPGMNLPSYKRLLKTVLKTNDRKLKQHWLQLKQRTGTSQPPHMSSDSGVIAFVANTPGGLGVVSASVRLPNSVKVLTRLD